MEKLQDNYLGFIVVKPLPDCVFGRTCLKHYGDDSGRRSFVAVRDYEVNLFGIPLFVRTLGFQEQDQVVAACATSALWSTFQATGCLWQHNLPSPIEITRAATSKFPIHSRVFPNTEGLTLEQMAHAIQFVGLEPYCIQPKSPFVLFSAIYSYVACKIPVLLVYNVEVYRDGEWRRLGLHAAAVTGYSLPSFDRWPDPDEAEPCFSSQCVDKIYVHDDQVGPHARMPLVVDGNDWWLGTSWGFGSCPDKVRARPDSLLVPLYNKIRIPYSVVYQAIMEFDRGLYALRKISSALRRARPVWDVRLVTVNSYKESVRGNPSLNYVKKEEILFERMPRFLWHATASVKNVLLIDILFDATDISSGRIVRKVHVHEPELDEFFKLLRSDSELRESEMGCALSRFLDQTYGAI